MLLITATIILPEWSKKKGVCVLFRTIIYVRVLVVGYIRLKMVSQYAKIARKSNLKLGLLG